MDSATHPQTEATMTEATMTKNTTPTITTTNEPCDICLYAGCRHQDYTVEAERRRQAR